MSQIMDARQARKDIIIQKMSRVRAAAAKLSDEDAVEFADLFEQWSGDGKELKVGDRVGFAGKLWKVLQAHTSQWEWTPTTAPSLFAEVLNPDDLLANSGKFFRLIPPNGNGRLQRLRPSLRRS